MPGYQPRMEDPVWIDGENINTYDAGTGLGVRLTELRGWDDAPQIRDVRSNRSGQDGEYADNVFLGGRTITLSGAVHGSSWADLQARKRALSAIFTPRSDETLLKIPDPNATAWEALWETELDELAPTAWWRLNDLALTNVAGGFSAYVSSLSPTAWWRLNDLSSPPVSNSYDSTVLARADTVAYWELGEASGTTAANSVSGGAYPGTYSGGYTMAASGPCIGSADTSVDFGGVDGRVAVNYNAALNPATWTFQAWLYIDSTAALMGVFDTRNANTGFSCRLNAGGALLAGVGTGAAYNYNATGLTLTTGRWIHLAITYDATNVRTYVDGVLGSTTATAYSQNLSDLFYIGSEGGSGYFNGKIAKVSLHNAALTASEIGSLFVKGRPVSDTQGSYAGGMIDAPTSAAGAIAGDSDACFDFDGSNDAVVIPYSANLNAATFSVAGWIYRDADTGATERIIDSRNSGGTNGYSLSVSASDKIQLTLADGTASIAAIGATSLATGTWHHVAATFNSATGAAIVYLNGVQDGSGTDAMTQNTTGATRIGQQYDGTLHFNGKIDELMYYGSTVLTAAQIQTLYAKSYYRVADEQGTYHGGRLGSPTTATGAVAYDTNAAYDFPGSGTPSSVVVPYTSALNAATFSLTGWIKRDSDTGGIETICNSRNSTGVNGWGFRITAADKLSLGVGDGTFSEVSGATSLAADTWYHCAATFDGSTTNVYLNGVLDGTGSDALVANTSGPFRIGVDYTGSANYFNGKIDELTYHGSTVLTATQIARLYDIGTFDHEVYDEDAMYSYERSSVRVIEPITFGDMIGSAAMTFQVSVRASDPLVYEDPASLGESITTGTATRTVTIDQDGTYATPIVATVTGPTGASWSVTDGDDLSVAFSGLTLASTESVAIDTLARTATLSSPYSQIRIREAALEAIWPLNESAGTTADNAEGTSALDGTYQNGVVLNQSGPSTGVPGVTLDGTNDYISIPYAAALADTTFTFETWVKPNGTFGTIAGDVNTGFTTGWWLTVGTAGNITAAFFAGAGKVSETQTLFGSAPSGTWTHVVLTMAGTTATPSIYVNGRLADDTSLYLTGTWVVSAATGIHLGRRANVTTPFYLAGGLGPTAFYSRVFDATEVSDLYAKRLATSTVSVYSNIEARSSRWATLDTTSTTLSLASDGLSTGSKLEIAYRDARL